jgi:hypothetical protein
MLSVPLSVSIRAGRVRRAASCVVHTQLGACARTHSRETYTGPLASDVGSTVHVAHGGERQALSAGGLLPRPLGRRGGVRSVGGGEALLLVRTHFVHELITHGRGEQLDGTHAVVHLL